MNKISVVDKFEEILQLPATGIFLHKPFNKCFLSINGSRVIIKLFPYTLKSIYYAYERKVRALTVLKQTQENLLRGESNFEKRGREGRVV